MNKSAKKQIVAYIMNGMMMDASYNTAETLSIWALGEKV